MKNNFSTTDLTISVSRGRTNETNIVLHISSDYSKESHKSQLCVDEGRLATEVERFWKSIKTKKLLSMNVGFGEIDWYDDETDMYETPSISIKRGLKRAKIGYVNHGSIPKDWSFEFACVFADTTTISPILEVVKSALGSHFSAKAEKEFTKAVRPFLQKKIKYANYEVKDAVEVRNSYSHNSFWY